MPDYELVFVCQILCIELTYIHIITHMTHIIYTIYSTTILDFIVFWMYIMYSHTGLITQVWGNRITTLTTVLRKILDSFEYNFGQINHFIQSFNYNLPLIRYGIWNQYSSDSTPADTHFAHSRIASESQKSCAIAIAQFLFSEPLIVFVCLYEQELQISKQEYV